VTNARILTSGTAICKIGKGNCKTSYEMHEQVREKRVVVVSSNSRSRSSNVLCLSSSSDAAGELELFPVVEAILAELMHIGEESGLKPSWLCCMMMLYRPMCTQHASCRRRYVPSSFVIWRAF